MHNYHYDMCASFMLGFEKVKQKKFYKCEFKNDVQTYINKIWCRFPLLKHSRKLFLCFHLIWDLVSLSKCFLKISQNYKNQLILESMSYMFMALQKYNYYRDYFKQNSEYLMVKLCTRLDHFLYVLGGRGRGQECNST